MNKKGLTLLESMISIAIAGAAMTGVLKYVNDAAKVERQEVVVNDLKTVISGVEKRLGIDGYGVSNWSQTTWNNSNEVKKLLREELLGINSTCGTGKWVPSLDTEKSAKLVKCNLWERMPYDMKASAELKSDHSGYISDFMLRFDFKNSDHFDKTVNEWREVIRKSASKSTTGDGLYTVAFVEPFSNVEITKIECLSAGMSGCSVLASYNRSGASEYIKADGSNSMINSNFTFVETTGASPLKCIRWKNTAEDGSGSWSQTLDEECGVGIYKETGHPTTVDVVSDNGTFENVLLDKECVSFKWNGSDVVPDGTSPCGMLSPSETIMVIDNIEAKTAVIQNASFSVVNTKSLFSNLISAKTIEATNSFKAAKAEIVNDIKIGGNATIVGDLSVKNVNADLVNATRVTADIGDFDNINNKFNELESDINSLTTKVYNNESYMVTKNKEQDDRIKELEEDLKNYGDSSTVQNSNYEAMMKECNSRPDTFIGQGTIDCTGIYAGTKTVNKYLQYYWNKTGNFCATDYRYVVVERNCWRDGK